MTEKEQEKLTITYDGKIYVTGYGTFKLGDENLADVISDALGLSNSEFRELNAEVVLSLILKAQKPKVLWK